MGEIIAALVERGISNEAGAAIRAGNAKSIFNQRRATDALAIVARSRRVPGTIAAEATRLTGKPALPIQT